MNRIVKATGPIPCRYMAIAERPGIVEHRRGYCLCGPSGEEFDRYLVINTGISRDAIYCTNLVKDYRDDESPSEEEIARDKPLLEAEIDLVQPQYIMLMGLYSARAFLGPDIDMDWSHGLCFPGKDGFLMPLIHVAAGLHQPRYAASIAWDFGEFGRMIREEPMPTGHLQDKISNPMYKEIRRLIVKGGSIGIDTEGSPEEPWCVSGSDMEGIGGVVLRRGPVKIDESLVILHNAIHDLQVLEFLGIRLGVWTDTMLMAGLLGTEPLSLKALARRHCGMVMQEYADVIAPAKREKALKYLAAVLDYAEANPTTASD